MVIVPKERRKRLNSWLAVMAAVVAFVATCISIYSFVKPALAEDLIGRWRLDLVIESTDFNPYHGLKVGYIVYLSQDGSTLSGIGEKWWENDKELSYSQHTKLQLDGKIQGDDLKLLFFLFGAERETVGQFTLKSVEPNELFVGTFTTTGADSRGSALLTRYPESG